MTTHNVYDPAKIQHEFTRKCLRYFYEDIPEGEYDGSEDDLREYAATINEGFGYDLDKRIASLEAERDGLREAHRELLRLARDVANQVRDTSWSLGALNKLTQYIDDLKIRPATLRQAQSAPFD